MIGKVSICQGTIWKGSLWFMGTFNVLRENKKTERDSWLTVTFLVVKEKKNHKWSKSEVKW